MNNSEHIPPKAVEDIDKARAMAQAEDAGRSSAAIDKAAIEIVEESWQNDKHVQFIDAAASAAEALSRDQGYPRKWQEERHLQGTRRAANAWETGLERNATVLESKHAVEFVTDSALSELERSAKRHARQADKAGRLAARAYDKDQKRQSNESDIAA